MVVASAIDVSRSWSGILTRFGIGIINIAVIVTLFSSTPDQRVPFMPLGDQTLTDLVKFVAILILSMVCGAVAISIGALVLGRKFQEPNRTARACRVGISGNVLLIEAYRDANAKAEIASGINGTIILVLSVGVLRFLYAWATGDFSFLGERSNAEFTGWSSGVVGLASFVASRLIEWSAIDGLDGIDESLDKYYPTTVVDNAGTSA